MSEGKRLMRPANKAVRGIENLLHPEHGCINFRDGRSGRLADHVADALIAEGHGIEIDEGTGVPLVRSASSSTTDLSNQ